MPGLERTQEMVRQASPSVDVALCRTNITAEDEVKSMVAECVKAYGRIDFASNNAGVGTTNSKTADTTVEMYDRICAVNEKGVSTNLSHVASQSTHALSSRMRLQLTHVNVLGFLV
jgi:NAD(P)-dependent dehydrogenase (short-subunit alcohol dehydrogenase family)